MKQSSLKSAMASFVALVTGACAAPAQTFTSLVSLQAATASKPQYGSLVQGFDGDLYGMAGLGGSNKAGALFKVSTGGTFTILHTFDQTDGFMPLGGLIQAADGTFYGTTYGGSPAGVGQVFKYATGGIPVTMVSFNRSDGSAPTAAPTMGRNGVLYGTTSGVDGSVYMITTAGKFTNLLSFNGTNAALPYAGLIQAVSGDLYGTANSGGKKGNGAIFTVSTANKVSIAFSFKWSGRGESQCRAAARNEREFLRGHVQRGRAQ